MASLRRLPMAIGLRNLHRPFSTAASRRSTFSPQPAPPRLPKEEQEMFEKLLRDNEAAGAFAAPRDASPRAQADEPAPERDERAASAADVSDRLAELRARIAAKGDGEELHPHVRRGAAPEFEGDVNPATGEVGGPKNNPLRWGQEGDWSYNGRVTDF